MKEFITCINGLEGTTQYAQTMVSNIAHQLGFRNMDIYFYNSKAESLESLNSRYDGIIAGISRGDIIFFQHPTWHPLKFEEGLINRIKAYGGRVVIVIHDIEPLMSIDSRFMLGLVIELFNSAEVLVVPSFNMKKFLLDNGVKENMKFVVQEIWDYITDIEFSQMPSFKKEIHFAGNPSKFLFTQQWNFDVPLKVYTSERYIRENVEVMGWKDSSSLLLEFAKGGFGLVWYGEDYWHQYLQYNNSLKLSAYLTAGIPVIVPRGISNQYLIEKNHLGLVVDSLNEAIEQVNNMAESDYQEYLRHLREFSPLLRKGYFTKKFLIDSIQMIMRQDLTGCTIPDMEHSEIEHFPVFSKKSINIMDMEETLEYVQARQSSIARFGDGEISLMTGHSIPYQDYDERLADRMKQIITSPDNDKLLVCLPDIFERLQRYTVAFNAFWNRHLEQYQNFYNEVISNKKCYGSAFISRPYIDLADKSMSGKHFQRIKELFADRDILIVEGFYSRSGVGSDLFQGARSVERIICPSRNAYSKYDLILDTIRKYGTNKLILLMLGPTAKVLASDLADEGYWAVDIGHIDSEYEWYRMGATYKAQIKNKHTAEYNFDEHIELQEDDKYTKEIVAMLLE